MIEVEINGERSQMDESLLEKKTGTDTSPGGVCHWVEYWLRGALVHRSVHIDLSKSLIGA
jgi:hypothetical protein